MTGQDRSSIIFNRSILVIVFKNERSVFKKERFILRHTQTRISAHGCAFATIIMSKIPSLDDGDDKSAEDGVMVVLGIPHRIEMAKSQLIPRFDGSSAGHELFESIGRAYVKSYGAILNSFAVMGGGVEAEGRRKRAKEMAVKARKVMEEGGSSFVDMTKMIQELRDVKKM